MSRRGSKAGQKFRQTLLNISHSINLEEDNGIDNEDILSDDEKPEKPKLEDTQNEKTKTQSNMKTYKMLLKKSSKPDTESEKDSSPAASARKRLKTVRLDSVDKRIQQQSEPSDDSIMLDDNDENL